MILDVYPYATEDYVACVIHAILSAVTVITCGITLVAMIPHHKSPSHVLLINMILVDFILYGVIAVVDIYNITRGGFAIGQSWCLFESAVTLITCCSEMLFLVAITVERCNPFMN